MHIYLKFYLRCEKISRAVIYVLSVINEFMLTKVSCSEIIVNYTLHSIREIFFKKIVLFLKQEKLNKFFSFNKRTIKIKEHLFFMQ